MSCDLGQSEQRNPFCVTFRRDKSKRAEIGERSFQKLCPKQTRVAGVRQRCGLKEAAVERVEWIVPGKVVFAAPREELIVNRLQNLSNL